MTYGLGSHKDERIEELRADLLDRDEHISKLEDALNEIYDMFYGEEDADQEPGDSRPTPNRAMKIRMLIDEALGGKRK